ncbi:hypothetical protein V6N11_001205 [Hibiscus sabdariffa]|uniref:Uncharacterized protein n=1 Tax=Hibiscus sabdariffa TaxID=183260 RepID=A0ABR2RZ29_9ROSI
MFVPLVEQLIHSDTQAGSSDGLHHDFAIPQSPHLNASHSDTRPHIVSQGDVPVTNEEAGLHRSAGGQVSPNQFQDFSDRRTDVVCSSREVPLELSDMPSQVAFTTTEGMESRVSDSEMVEAIPVQLATTDSSTRVNDGLPEEFGFEAELQNQDEEELQNQAEVELQSQTEEEAVDFSSGTTVACDQTIDSPRQDGSSKA